MMPLDASFTPVYEAMLRGVTQHGWHTGRAADLSTNGPIIQEIVDLIATSQVVICDLSGRNPNVFYEAGIAHTLGKDVILLASHQSDVPFDLQHLRYIPYVNNDQGLEALVSRVLQHLDTINSNTISAM